jgi:hypothetical protein
MFDLTGDDYFLKFMLLVLVSATIADTVIRFVEHLGYPQTIKTKLYLAGVIFSIIFQLLLLLQAFRRELWFF